MRKPGHICIMILVTALLWQCSSSREVTTTRNKNLKGTYRIAKMSFPDENLTFHIDNPQKTFENVVNQIKVADPGMNLDSAKVREQVELDLISIGAFSMTFNKDGSYRQSEFFYNNSTAPPFSGFFIIDQNHLILLDSQSDVYDTYEVVKRSGDQLTLQKLAGNKSRVMFIIVLEKVKE